MWTAFCPALAHDARLPEALRPHAVPFEARLVAAAKLVLAMAEPRARRSALRREEARAFSQRAPVLDAKTYRFMLAHFDTVWPLAARHEAAALAAKTASAAHKQPPPASLSTPALAQVEEERLIAAALAGGIEFRPCRRSCSRLSRFARDETSGVRQYAKMLACDGALAGALFRVVRSPVFGQHAHVDSLEEAIAVLGFKTTLAVVRGEAAQRALYNLRHARVLALWGSALAP